MPQPTLILLCKRPAYGVGKQRLANKLGEEIALQIAQALLACALEDFLIWPGRLVISPASGRDQDWALNLCHQTPQMHRRSDIEVIPQHEGNLGQRLNSLDKTLRESGHHQLIYIGSDAPDLGITDFMAASKALLNTDTVLKPTIDGGVSIMASRKPWPDLTELPWSTEKLCQNLSALCQDYGHSINTLSKGFDVDEMKDLHYLIGTLGHDSRATRQEICTLARQIIQQKSSKQKVMMRFENSNA